ncbi:MAG: hypothetical protein A3F74_14235 [Betaproteobacteria bacterium RIFCSPLOWO2_12_FULL_62_58]|nr:MAG: hypothetical protein A3F74_14235 [Betaproteobacteria bacterium RIFCSPLOWO2_12_FULL_62_58]
MVTAMKRQDLFAYQDLISRATKDIHDRCDVDLSILWDDGKLEPVAGTHTVKVWNGLGSVSFQIEHDDLVDSGAAYRLFLEKVVSAVKQKLTLNI